MKGLPLIPYADHPALAEYSAYVETLEMRPWRVSAILSSPVVFYHPLHFDAILSYAVVEAVTEGEMLEPNKRYDINLPLKTLWRDPETQSRLFASTDMVDAYALKQPIYYHRRALEAGMTTKNLNTTSGRHKEKRTPFTASSGVFSSDVIGNADEIARLLSRVTSIGKKRHTLGTVREWRIEEIDTFELFTPDSKARRPIPTEYLGLPPLMLTMPYVAFTPPYWMMINKDWCVDSGMAKPS